MPQVATIKSLPAAFRMMKTLQAEGVEWGEDDRTAARVAAVDVLATRMAVAIGRHLAGMAAAARARSVADPCRRAPAGEGGTARVDACSKRIHGA